MALQDELPEWALPMYAAAWQNYDELRKEPPVSRADLVTVDEQMARDAARTALEIIYDYAVREPAARGHMGSGETIRRHIVRSRCLVEMRGRWANAWRDTPAQEHAFNSACQTMGWFRARDPVQVTLNAAQACEAGVPCKGDRAKVPGVALTDARLAQLENYLFGGDGESGANPPSPLRGEDLDAASTASHLPCTPNSRQTAAAPMPRHAYYAGDTRTNDRNRPRARDALKEKAPYLAGDAAIAAVRAILAEPGPCTLDFETFPTAASWHGDQAALAAPRGKKGEARARAERTAELNRRAHLRRPCVLSLRHANGAEVVVRLASGDDPAPRRHELQAMFAECHATLIAHNAQFECEVLLGHGVALDIECTWLMAKCLLAVAYDKEVHKQAPPVRFGLADLVEREFGRVRDKRVRDRDWRDPASLDEEGVEYCRQDARDALELHALHRARLEAEGLWDGYRLIQQAILPTCAINLVGMEFDAEAHRLLTTHLRNRAARLERILDEVCGGAIRKHGSSQQVGKWIMDQVLAGDYADSPYRLGNFVARLSSATGGEVRWALTKKTKQLAISKHAKTRQAKALAPHYPVVARYLRASALLTEVKKLADSFGEGLARWVDPDGRLRSQLAAGGTITLRHNAQHPPVQEMPRRKSFRRLFRAPEGRRLVGCDYSQIELRLAAIEAKDEALLEVYRRGEDVHAAVAGNVDLPRGQAKPVSFTMIYGGGASKVAESAGVAPEKGQAVLEGFLRAYSGIARYRERAPLEAQKRGYITIRPGRRVRYDPAISRAPQAVNYPIQGGAASVQMRALRRVHDVLVVQPWLDTQVVGAIHDEFLLEAPDDERAEIAAGILQYEMRAALLDVFPEAAEQGADRLAAAEVLTTGRTNHDRDQDCPRRRTRTLSREAESVPIRQRRRSADLQLQGREHAPVPAVAAPGGRGSDERRAAARLPGDHDPGRAGARRARALAALPAAGPDRVVEGGRGRADAGRLDRRRPGRRASPRQTLLAAPAPRDRDPADRGCVGAGVA